MPTLLAILMSCLLIVAPLLPARAGAADTVVLCIDGTAQEVALDANGNPIPPCLLGNHCSNCVILSTPGLVDPTALAQPLWTDTRLMSCPPPVRLGVVLLPEASARAPPFPVL